MTKRKKISKLEEEIFVVSTGYDIFLLDKNKPIKITSRQTKVFSLCYHEGKLYDGNEWGKIYETLNNRIVADRYKGDTKVIPIVYALCSHEGKLYDGGNYGIYETLSNKKIVERKEYIWCYALCSHEGKLYDGGNYGIYETLSNRFIINREACVSALFSYERKLYDATFLGEIYLTMDNKLIVKREGAITDLCSCNNKLYDCGEGGIYETLKNKLVLWRPIMAICAVPRKFFVDAGIIK